MSRVKHYPIQLMNHCRGLLSAKEARQELLKKQFPSVYLHPSNFIVLVRTQDLGKIIDEMNFHILDDDGTELTRSDAKKIQKSEDICE